MYVFREQLQKRKTKFKILKICFLCLIFLVISVRVVRNYKIPPYVDYTWKMKTVSFDRKGDVFYTFPINPEFWSIGFSSSSSRDNYIPKSLEKQTINKSHIVSVNDLVVKDSLYIVTGSHPSVCYQLQGTLPAFCWLDFDHSIEALCMNFISEIGEEFPVLLCLKENNLLSFHERIRMTKMKFVHLKFYDTIWDGSFVLPDSSFVIKQFHLYALPSQ
jgi:hypothetical protein